MYLVSETHVFNIPKNLIMLKFDFLFEIFSFNTGPLLISYKDIFVANH